jgi:2-C-methyl-D-erythritol 2,4-cyclodiphosphate synthase
MLRAGILHTICAVRFECPNRRLEEVSALHRVGYGYDLHCTAPGRALMLGGVQVPHESGLRGHSDADVVLHAICDALLGAAALGDIGELFPDDDPRYKDADSRALLTEVIQRVGAAGFRCVNVDCVIHAQQPKLTPHKRRMRVSVADLLGLKIEAVSIKATTNEGLDAVGRGEAIACAAVALLVQVD